jgi:quercetin dioxygenase-like cupin family protein
VINKKSEEVMKKISLLFVVVIGLFALVSTAYAGDGNVYIVENGKDNVPVVTDKGAFSLADFGKAGDETNSGAKLAYGMHTMIHSSVKIMYVTLEAGGYIGNHGGPPNYVAIITQGDGVYGHGTANGKANKIAGSEINFKKGDVIVIKPNAFHWWKGGKEKVEMWVIEYPQYYD